VTEALQPVSPDLLESSRRLIALGPRTLGQDLALARSPIWHLVSTTLNPGDLVSPSGPLVHVAGPSLTIADQRAFAELFTAWARRGFPVDHRVSYTISDLATALGLQGKGGKQYALVRASLRRLTSAVFAAVQADGVYEREAGAGLLADYEARSRPGARCRATLNERTARTLLRYPLTYLHAPTWDAIMARDLLAARLWVWLEGERIRDEWRWSLFPDSREPVVLGLQPAGRRTTPIAHLLTIDTWARRRKIVERIRGACSVVEDADPRYELHVEPAVGDRGNYVLRCRRSPRAPVAEAGAEVVGELEAAWHVVSPRRRLSARQAEVMRELVSEWGVAAVAQALSQESDSDDPFAAVVEAAASWRHERDSAWEHAKAIENAAAPAALEQVRERIARRAAAVRTSEAHGQGGVASLRDLLSDVR